MGLALAILAGSGKLAAAAAAGKAHPGDTAQTIFLLSAYPNAICNDGTPGAYYFRKSQDGSTKWLFYLEGGQQCHDDTSCMKNRTQFMIRTTSTGWTVPSPGGILSPVQSDNPALWDANTVEVHSCSGDVWSGDKVATTAFMPGNADSGWYFEGRAIAVAAIMDLAARNQDTGFLSATDIVYSGSSGGALGVTYTLHDLKPHAPAGATARLAIDAGFSLQFDMFDHKAPPDYTDPENPYTEILTAGIPFWNGHGDKICAQRAVTLTDQITCYDTSALLASDSFSLPTFIAQSQLDTNQLSKHKWGGPVYADTPHTTYATEWVNATMTALMATGPHRVVFAPQREMHTMFVGNGQFGNPEQFPGYTLTPAGAFASWYAAPYTGGYMFGNAEGLQ